MKTEQKKWDSEQGWRLFSANTLPAPEKAQLVLVFGDREWIENDSQWFERLKAFYPNAHILSASTSGNILGVNLHDNTIVSTAIVFDKASIKTQKINITDVPNSFDAGQRLVESLPKEHLRHVFVISDGQKVNGSELVKGLTANLPSSVFVTGGLAGDGVSFQKTLVGLDTLPIPGEIAVVGFYGESLWIGFSSVGGWDAFGPERVITRSSGNTLYELDKKSALDLYKTYLGEQAEDLPGSALLFPLAIRQSKDETSIVRTILNVNEQDKSMIFAGDMPEGWRAQLMRANFDRLIDGAVMAANSSYQMLSEHQPQLAILISCVGRRIVLDQRIEEELEGVADILGKKTPITGFYSYGEIAPTAPNAGCDLHNQTMTITTFGEK